jgi:hypothetical protein
VPREISDEEYNFLQGRRQVADFVEPIYNHPQWGKEAKRLIKQVYPAVKIPDYDIEEQVNARFDAEKKARDDAAAAERQRADDERWRSTRANVQKQYGFTDEGMTKLEQFMRDKYIGDYEVAASYMAAKEPKTSEANYAGGHYWHHDRAPEWGEMSKDPESYAFNQFVQAMGRDEQRAKQQR